LFREWVDNQGKIETKREKGEGRGEKKEERREKGNPFKAVVSRGRG
jgi:hypothetical protein